MTEVVAALIWNNDKFLICQRPAHKARGLLWEFVGGKVEPGETKEQALIRECQEELGLSDVEYEYLGLMYYKMAPGYLTQDGITNMVDCMELHYQKNIWKLLKNTEQIRKKLKNLLYIRILRVRKK